MLLYNIVLEGDYMTFMGAIGTQKEGKKISYRKSSVKKVVSNELDTHLTLIRLDSTTVAYAYNEVEDPSTPGAVFASLALFRTFILTNLT